MFLFVLFESALSTRLYGYEFHSTTTDVQPALSSSHAVVDPAAAVYGDGAAVRVLHVSGSTIRKLHVLGGCEAADSNTSVPAPERLAATTLRKTKTEALHPRRGRGEGERDLEEIEADEPDQFADQKSARPGDYPAPVLQRSDQHDALGAADGILQVDHRHHEGREYVCAGRKTASNRAGHFQPGRERSGLRLLEFNERHREHDEDPTTDHERQNALRRHQCLDGSEPCAEGVARGATRGHRRHRGQGGLPTCELEANVNAARVHQGG